MSLSCYPTCRVLHLLHLCREQFQVQISQKEGDSCTHIHSSGGALTCPVNCDRVFSPLTSVLNRLLILLERVRAGKLVPGCASFTSEGETSRV